MTKAVEANNTLGVLLYGDNHLSVDSLIELEYAMGRPKRPVRELLGQVSNIMEGTFSTFKEVGVDYFSIPHRQS